MQLYAKCIKKSNDNSFIGVEEGEMYKIDEKGFYSKGEILFHWDNIYQEEYIPTFGEIIKIKGNVFSIELSDEDYDEIRQDMKECNIEDNPFDVMLRHALEMTRGIMYMSRRYKNPLCSQSVVMGENEIKEFFENIMNEFAKIYNAKDKTIEVCRKTSYVNYMNIADELNSTLYHYEKLIPTVFSDTHPVRPDLFEKIRLGESSSEYIRNKELRKLAKDLRDRGYSYRYLESMIDGLLDNCELDENQAKYIEEYALNIENIMYMECVMISYEMERYKEGDGSESM